MTGPALSRSEWPATALPQSPGVYPGVPFDEYLGWVQNVSKHMLDAIARSPAHYRAALEQPRAQTPAMAFGAALHTLVLEPSRFARAYVMLPDDAPPKPTKRQVAAKKPSAETTVAIAWWNAWNAEHAGKTVLNCENGDWDNLHHVRDAIRAHPYASILLAPEDGGAEVSIAWVDEETGVPCRARPDFLNHAHNVCVDLKTAADASMGVFARACANYTYHLQAAFYLDGLAAVKQPHDKFVFVGAEPEPPYAVACYELAEEDVRIGRVRYRQALRTYQECLASDTWPSYPEEIRVLELPAWAKFVPIS